MDRKITLLSRLKNLTRFAILGFIIPIILSFVVYAGFNTTYTSQGLTLQGFTEQYFNGVYRYRILGRSLLLDTYELIKAWGLPIIPTKLGDPQFYSAYFYLNTLFLCFTCASLYFVLQGQKQSRFSAVDLPLLFLCSLMALSQFVVVPYDILSYFLLALSALLILQPKKTVWNTLALGILVILSTLTRESAFLILSFYFAVNYARIIKKPSGFRLNHEQISVLVIGGCFATTYLVLRLVLGFSRSLFQNMTLIGNNNLLSALGALFLFSMVFLLLFPRTTSKESILFTIAAVPYLLPMFLIAVLWEIRLWVPFLMLLLILVLKNDFEINQGN